MGKFYGSNRDEGPFYIGPCDTMEEVVEEFRSEYEEEIAENNDGGTATTCYVGQSREVSLDLCGDSIIDDVMNNYYDELHEDAFDGWCQKISREDKAELGKKLTKTFHAWLKQHKQDTEITTIDHVKEFDVFPDGVVWSGTAKQRSEYERSNNSSGVGQEAKST
jgi:hypothetical protein